MRFKEGCHLYKIKVQGRTKITDVEVAGNFIQKIWLRQLKKVATMNNRYSFVLINFKYILLINLLQLSRFFSLLYPPSALHPLHPPAPPTPLSSCPWWTTDFQCKQNSFIIKEDAIRTYIARETSQFLASKLQRLTILLVGNASGDFKLKSMLTYHYKNPKALRIMLS